MSATPFEPDVSALCLRIARKLEDDGYTHPVEAAVALTVRGRQGLTISAFAAALDVDDALVAQAEHGDLRVHDWPLALWELVEDETPEFATLLSPARNHPAGQHIAGATPG